MAYCIIVHFCIELHCILKKYSIFVLNYNTNRYLQPANMPSEAFNKLKIAFCVGMGHDSL
jgi:hypothetical protein